MLMPQAMVVTATGTDINYKDHVKLTTRRFQQSEDIAGGVFSVPLIWVLTFEKL